MIKDIDDIINEYELLCKNNNIQFHINNSVRSPDNTTLFCSSGMQRFKNIFLNPETKMILGNIQKCLRLNDINEIGDGSHLLTFNMIGLFSFDEWDTQKTIDFFLYFLDLLNIKTTKIISDINLIGTFKVNLLTEFCDNYTWSDGNLIGYSTEFFVNDLEIGNIVTIKSKNKICIDTGFGLERIYQVINPEYKKDKNETLKDTILTLINDGYKPGNKKQEYVLRQLLRTLTKNNGILEHEYFIEEKMRQKEMIEKYNRLKNKYKNKDKFWWFDTHGIDLDDV